MSGWVLLIIGLLSLGLVVAVLAYLGYAAWRVGRRALHASRRYGPLVAELTRKVALAEQRGEQASRDALEIQRNVEHLQATLARLQVAGEAFQRAAKPYRRLRSYLGR